MRPVNRLHVMSDGDAVARRPLAELFAAATKSLRDVYGAALLADQVTAGMIDSDTFEQYYYSSKFGEYVLDRRAPSPLVVVQPKCDDYEAMLHIAWSIRVKAVLDSSFIYAYPIADSPVWAACDYKSMGCSSPDVGTYTASLDEEALEGLGLIGDELPTEWDEPGFTDRNLIDEGTVMSLGGSAVVPAPNGSSKLTIGFIWSGSFLVTAAQITARVVHR